MLTRMVGLTLEAVGCQASIGDIARPHQSNHVRVDLDNRDVGYIGLLQDGSQEHAEAQTVDEASDRAFRPACRS